MHTGPGSQSSSVNLLSSFSLRPSLQLVIILTLKALRKMDVWKSQRVTPVQTAAQLQNLEEISLPSPLCTSPILGHVGGWFLHLVPGCISIPLPSPHSLSDSSSLQCISVLHPRLILLACEIINLESHNYLYIVGGTLENKLFNIHRAICRYSV